MKASAPRRDLAVCLLAYCVATVGAVLAAIPFEGPVMRAAVGDVVATGIIFGFSRRVDNSSMYDAYWSVAPVLIFLFWIWSAPSVPGPAQWLTLSLVLAWSVRLTWNWASGWEGLWHEDWRYVDLRAEHPRTYWWVSFFGLHMMPTALVFLACLPLFSIAHGGTRDLGTLPVLAAALTAAAIIIEAVADRQLRIFRETSDGSSSIETGLWAWSRHPNYFGETLFWWGLLAIGFATVDPLPWWARIGAPAIAGLFLFVSIPMMERRMISRRPDYAARRAAIPALVPWRLPRAVKDARRR